MSAQDFSEEQRRYLEGFVSGVQARRASQGLKPLGAEGGAAPPAGPDKEHLAAMARFEAAGKKLSPEEKAKRDEHPFDAYARLREESAKGQFPKGIDNFRWRFHGLFYLAPTQNSYMCRLRIPNGILTHWQFAGVADLAERYGGGYAHVTTRANLQIRDVMPEGAIPLIEGLAGLGIPTKGTGADNIRNVTGSPTAGIDPRELIDTRPFARAWHHHILNDRSLYGLPRKFNVGFDGGGAIPVLEDTNDIAFTAVTVGEGAGVDAGVWFRLGLGGITGHQDFARLGGVYVKPDEAVAVADAIVRVFIANGDRTDRKKARLKYVLDAWGLDKFLAEVEAKLGRKLVRLAEDRVSAPNRQDRQAHIGFHAQKQAGKVWAGVALPVGKLTSEQMRGLARIAHDLGDGDIRLTVWQNLLLSGIDEANTATDRDVPAPDRPHRQGNERARRPDRLHRQHRVQVRAVQHQGHRHGHCRVGGAARCPRQPHQHPPHRLPQLLCPTLHRRHRPARLPGERGCGGGGHSRGLPRVRRRRLRRRCRHRPRALPRREGARLPATHRAHPPGLRGAPRRRGRDVPRLHAPA